MGICGLKGQQIFEHDPHQQAKSILALRRNKINADYCQIPNDIHRKYHEISETQLSGLVGLQNLGNTCFINSALQCLLNVQPLRDYFLSDIHKVEVNLDNPLGSKGSITSVFAEIIDKIQSENNKLVVPLQFLNVIRQYSSIFGDGTQQDAHEFLIFLLDYLHEDLNRVRNKPYIADKDYESKDEKEFESFASESWKNYLMRNKSIVVDLFQGQLKSTLRCLTCQTVSHKFETFMYLSLPVPSKENKQKISMEECLLQFTTEEELGEDEWWHCTHCKKRTPSTKKIDLWKTPNILIVHFKRFQFNRNSVGKKLQNFIQFQLTEFNLASSVTGLEKNPPIYDLFAVCNHEGSLGGGHYTACCKSWETAEWFQFNDSQVTSIDNPDKKVLSSKAYLLFYCKTSVDKFQRQTISKPEFWPHIISQKSITEADQQKRGNTFTNLCIVQPSNEKGVSPFISRTVTINHTIPKRQQINQLDPKKKLLNNYRTVNKSQEELHEEDLENKQYNDEGRNRSQGNNRISITKTRSDCRGIEEPKIFEYSNSIKLQNKKKQEPPYLPKVSGERVIETNILNENDNMSYSINTNSTLMQRSKRTPRKKTLEVKNNNNSQRPLDESEIIEEDEQNNLMQMKQNIQLQQQMQVQSSIQGVLKQRIYKKSQTQQSRMIQTQIPFQQQLNAELNDDTGTDFLNSNRNDSNPITTTPLPHRRRNSMNKQGEEYKRITQSSGQETEYNSNKKQLEASQTKVNNQRQSLQFNSNNSSGNKLEEKKSSDYLPSIIKTEESSSLEDSLRKQKQRSSSQNLPDNNILLLKRDNKCINLQPLVQKNYQKEDELPFIEAPHSFQTIIANQKHQKGKTNPTSILNSPFNYPGYQGKGMNFHQLANLNNKADFQNASYNYKRFEMNETIEQGELHKKKSASSFINLSSSKINLKETESIKSNIPSSLHVKIVTNHPNYPIIGSSQGSTANTYDSSPDRRRKLIVSEKGGKLFQNANAIHF